MIKQTTLLLSTILLMSSCSKKEEKTDEQAAKKSSVEQQITKVDAEIVTKQTFNRELLSNGKLYASGTALVPFEVGGMIESVVVTTGQWVEKGNLLATIDDYSYTKQLGDAEIAFNKAMIDMEDQLLGFGYAMKDTAQVSDDVLKMCRIRSGLTSATANLKQAQHNLEKCKIVAPISGVIANLNAKANNHSGTYKSCCEIHNSRTMEFQFNVLEGELNMVQQGQQVMIEPFANTKAKYQGTIKHMNPVVQDGLVLVTAEVKNRNKDLIHGMSAKALIQNQQHETLVIPKNAVLYRQNRKVVFTVKCDSIAWWTYVETGEENSSHITITDDKLKPGDTIIVSNNLNLAHETPVRVATLR